MDDKNLLTALRVLQTFLEKEEKLAAATALGLDPCPGCADDTLLLCDTCFEEPGAVDGAVPGAPCPDITVEEPCRGRLQYQYEPTSKVHAFSLGECWRCGARDPAAPPLNRRFLQLDVAQVRELVAALGGDKAQQPADEAQADEAAAGETEAGEARACGRPVRPGLPCYCIGLPAAPGVKGSCERHPWR